MCKRILLDDLGKESAHHFCQDTCDPSFFFAFQHHFSIYKIQDDT